MKMSNALMRSAAAAVCLCLTIGTSVSIAQESQQQSNQAQSDKDQQTQGGQQSTSQTNSMQQDRVVATVGDVEIMGSDLATVIGALPPRLQAQSPDMLIPIAMQQLIVRELILDEARSQNLIEDPEVVALVEAETQTAEDDAVVQVWLDREMAKFVTDAAVQQAYDNAQANAESQGSQDFAPLEQVRPQIEQYLRQQAMQDIQARLRQGADIIFYDATGRPIEESQGSENGNTGESASDSGDGSAQSADSADRADQKSSENESGSVSPEDSQN